ncbi:lipopolysaccharide biosynthesis protein [Pontibacter harenae]|uniref:lipopolysaccharide biosynthesis protein n=1 Tax=Pontibacter harenae TaxID=2894083 RepID=UPI001E447C3F|nr:oligosaccharide flippase family protein [Pontibacter harenae]MCC9166150.1 hypothetical protein [Pontibacter harenae]
MKGSKGKVLKGVSFSWIKFATSIAFGIILTPLIFKLLNKNEINYWYLFFSIGSFLQMADLGLASALSRTIAYINNSKEGNSDSSLEVYKRYTLKQIYYTALLTFLICVIIIFFVSVVAFSVLDSTNISIITIAYVVYGVGVILNLISNIPSAFLSGLEDVGYDNLVKVLAQVVYFILIVTFLEQFPNILFLSGLFLLQNLIQLLLLHITLYKKHKFIFSSNTKVKSLFAFEAAKEIYKNSMPMFINQLGGWLTNRSVIFITTITVGTAYIADLSVHQQLISYGVAIVSVINQSVGPFIAKKYIKEGRVGVIPLFEKVVILALSLITAFALFVILAGNEILQIWIGTGHFLGNSVITLLAISAILEIQHAVCGNFVWNLGKWPFNYWTLAAGILSMVLGYILGNAFGLEGLVFAFTLSKLLTINWYVVYYCLKELNYNIFKFIINYPFMMLLMMSVIIVVVKLTNLLSFFNESPLTSIIVICLIAAMYLFIVLIKYKDKLLTKNIKLSKLMDEIKTRRKAAYINVK